MLSLILLLWQALAAQADSSITVLSIEPRTVGSNLRTQVTVHAQLAPSPKLNDQSVFLYHIDQYGSSIGDPLCQLFDDGDSRHADDHAKDGIFSCIAFVSPRWPTKLGMVVRAKYNGLISSSAVYVMYAVDGDKLTEKEHDEVRRQIMEQVRKIWQRNKAAHGLTDSAAAGSIREIKLIDGVHDARLGGDGDIFIYFEVGGRDQIHTFSSN